MKKTITFAHILNLLITVCVSTGFAATHEVATDSDLHTALTQAASGDTILVAGGTYSPIVVTDGRTLTIQRKTATDVVIIDGAGTDRCAMLASASETNATVTLSGLTLVNGRALDGAGVFCGMLENCVVSNCVATYSGGGMLYGSAVGTTFCGNTAGTSGGGASSATLTQCTFTDNTAERGGGAASSEVTRSTFTGNRAAFGGGACLSTVTASTFRENSATCFGSAVYGGTAFSVLVVNNTADGGTATVAAAKLVNATLIGNIAGDVGGSAMNSVSMNNIYWSNVDTRSITNVHTRTTIPADAYDSTLSHAIANMSINGENVTIVTNCNEVFRDYDAGNYRIFSTNALAGTSGSVAFDAGDSMASVYGRIDAAGYQRYQGEQIDIGAFEAPTGAAFTVPVMVQGVGSVTPSGDQTVQPGDMLTLTATENAQSGRNFIGFYVNGEIVSTSLSYTFEPQKDDAVVARFDGLYVSTSGLDTNDGLTAETAKATLAGAFAIAADSDTIYIDAGSYDVASTTKNVTLQAIGKVTETTISGSAVFSLGPQSTICGLTVSGVSGLTSGTVHRSIITGCTGTLSAKFTSSLIQNGAASFASTATIQNCTIVNMTAVNLLNGVVPTQSLLSANTDTTSATSPAPLFVTDDPYKTLTSTSTYIDAGTTTPTFFDALDLRGQARVRGAIDLGATESNYGSVTIEKIGYGTLTVDGTPQTDASMTYTRLLGTTMTLTATPDAVNARPFSGYTLPNGSISSGETLFWTVSGVESITANFTGLNASDTATLATAVANAQPGETITLAAGSYTIPAVPENILITSATPLDPTAVVITGTVNGGSYEAITFDAAQISGAKLTRCLVRNASGSPAISTSSLINTIVVSNTVDVVVQGGSALNCTILDNTATTAVASGTSVTNTIIEGTLASVTQVTSLTTRPTFVDGTFELIEGAATAIDAGTINDAMGDMDFYGEKRVSAGRVDIGASEWPAPPYTLTVVRNGYGTVTVGDAVINAGTNTVSVERGTSVTLTAASAAAHPRALNSITLNGTSIISGHAWTPEASDTVVVTFADITVSGSGTDLQTKIDDAQPGETLRVEPGTYSSITTENKAIRIIATARDPKLTIIDGENKNRAATLGASEEERDTVLIGFTIQHGRNNEGAGVYGGTLHRCIIRENTVTYNGLGAGVYGSAVYNSLILKNGSMAIERSTGGGAAHSSLVNCTVVENVATLGGGVYECVVCNCICARNRDGDGNNSDWYGETVPDPEACCTPVEFGTGNVAGDPCFVDPDNENYALCATSPCLNVGNVACDYGVEDLEGQTRVYNGRVDIGAYEWCNPPYTVTVKVKGYGHGTVTVTNVMTDVVFGTPVVIDVPRGTEITLAASSFDAPNNRVFTGINTNGVQATTEQSLTWTPHSANTRFAEVEFEFGDLVVGGENKTHTTITEALSTAKDSEVIRLTPGVYAESMNVPEGVSIIATGSLAETVITNGTHTLTNAFLKGVTIVGGLGVAGGTLDHCIVRETAGTVAVADATLLNCLVLKNTGDGIRNTAAYASTIVDNRGTGAAQSSVLHSSVVWYNETDIDATVTGDYSCTSVTLSGIGNIVPEGTHPEPGFMSPTPYGENYTPSARSYCINNGGENLAWLTWDTDLYGNARTVFDTMDIGAIEFGATTEEVLANHKIIHFSFDNASDLYENTGSLGTNVTETLGSSITTTTLTRPGTAGTVSSAVSMTDSSASKIDFGLSVSGRPSASNMTISYIGTFTTETWKNSMGFSLAVNATTNLLIRVERGESNNMHLYVRRTVNAVTTDTYMTPDDSVPTVNGLPTSNSTANHIVITIRNAELTLYINGVAGSSYTLSDEARQAVLSAVALGDGYDTGRSRLCTADDLRVYNQGMTATQVQDLYNQLCNTTTVESSSSGFSWYGSQIDVNREWSTTVPAWIKGYYGAPVPFVAGEDVTFADRAGFKTAQVTVNDTLSVGAANFMNETMDYRFVGNGSLVFSGIIFKYGVGALEIGTSLAATKTIGVSADSTLVLSGSNSERQITGAMTLGQNSTVRITDGSTTMAALTIPNATFQSTNATFKTTGNVTVSGSGKFAVDAGPLNIGGNLSLAGSSSARFTSPNGKVLGLVNVSGSSRMTFGPGTYTIQRYASLGSARGEVYEGTTLTVENQLRTHDQYGATDNFYQYGGTVTVNGTGTGKSSGVHIGHWGGNSSTYNIYAGELNVPNGTIQLGLDGTGYLNIEGGTVSSKTLVINGGYASVKGGTLILRGAPTGGTGAIRMESGELRLAANVEITSIVQLKSGLSTFNLSGGNFTLKSPLTGVGGFRKIGSKTLYVKCMQDFTGPMIIEEGPVVLSSTPGFAGDIEVGAGASFTFSDSAISGETTLNVVSNTTMTVRGGSTVAGMNLDFASMATFACADGSSAVNGDVTFQNGATFAVTLRETAADTRNGCVNVTGAVTLASGIPLKIELPDGTLQAGETYTLLTASEGITVSVLPVPVAVDGMIFSVSRSADNKRLLLSATGHVPSYARTLTANTTWNKTDEAWLDGGTSAVFTDGFDTTITATDDVTLSLADDVSMRNLTINVADGKTLTLVGTNDLAVIGAFTKVGGGTLMLNNDVVYVNGITVNAGIIGTTNNNIGYVLRNVTLSEGTTLRYAAALPVLTDVSRIQGEGALEVANGNVTMLASQIVGNFDYIVRSGASLALPSASYTGDVTVESGTFALAGGSITGNITATGTSTLNIAGTVNGNISADNLLFANKTMIVNGALTANTVTAANGGSFTVGNVQATTWSQIAGTLKFSATNTIQMLTLQGALTFTATGALTVDTLNATQFTGTFSLNNCTLTTANDVAISNCEFGSGVVLKPVSGTTLSPAFTAATQNGFTKEGSGTVSVTGIKTFSGMTTLKSGTLALQSANALGTAGLSLEGGRLELADSITVDGLRIKSGSVIALGATSRIDSSSDIVIEDDLRFVIDFTGINDFTTPLTLMTASEFLVAEDISALAYTAENLPTGVALDAVFLTNGKELSLEMTRVNNLAWGTATSGTWNTTAENTPWLLGGTAAAYSNGTGVTFTNTAPTTVSLATAVTPIDILFANTADLTISGEGSIQGDTLDIVKRGVGTTTLNVPLTTGGGIRVDTGSLNLAGGAGVNGVVAGDIAIASGASLALSGSSATELAGFISGEGLLAITSSSTVTLAGANAEFSGLVRVNDGTLSISNNSAIVASALNLNGGDLDVVDGMTAAMTSVSVTQSANITLGADAKLMLSGAWTQEAATTVTFNLNVDTNTVAVYTLVEGPAGVVFPVDKISVSLVVGGNLVGVLEQSGNRLVYGIQEKRLTWTGAVNDVWNMTNKNWVYTGTSVESAFFDGATVTFGPLVSGTASVTISGTVSPDAVIFDGDATAYTISDGTLAAGSITTMNGAEACFSGVTQSGNSAISVEASSRFTVENGTFSVTSPVTGSGTVCAGVGGSVTLSGDAVPVPDAAVGLEANDTGRIVMDVVSWTNNVPGSVIISGTGTFEKSGSGTLPYEMKNIRTANIAVNAGTFEPVGISGVKARYVRFRGLKRLSATSLPTGPGSIRFMRDGEFLAYAANASALLQTSLGGVVTGSSANLLDDNATTAYTKTAATTNFSGNVTFMYQIDLGEETLFNGYDLAVPAAAGSMFSAWEIAVLGADNNWAVVDTRSYDSDYIWANWAAGDWLSDIEPAFELNAVNEANNGYAALNAVITVGANGILDLTGVSSALIAGKILGSGTVNVGALPLTIEQLAANTLTFCGTNARISPVVITGASANSVGSIAFTAEKETAVSAANPKEIALVANYGSGTAPTSGLTGYRASVDNGTIVLVSESATATLDELYLRATGASGSWTTNATDTTWGATAYTSARYAYTNNLPTTIHAENDLRLTLEDPVTPLSLNLSAVAGKTLTFQGTEKVAIVEASQISGEGTVSFDATLAAQSGAVKARYVRLSVKERPASGNHPDAMSLQEIELTLGGTSIGLTGATATASSSASSHAASCAIDGSIAGSDTKWMVNSANFGSAGKDAGATGAWLKIDLGSEREFDGYRLAMADQNGRNPMEWTLEISSNDSTWTLVDSKSYTEAEVLSWTTYAWRPIILLSDVDSSRAGVTVAPGTTLTGTGMFSVPVNFIDAKLLPSSLTLAGTTASGSAVVQTADMNPALTYVILKIGANTTDSLSLTTDNSSWTLLKEERIWKAIHNDRFPRVISLNIGTQMSGSSATVGLVPIAGSKWIQTEAGGNTGSNPTTVISLAVKDQYGTNYPDVVTYTCSRGGTYRSGNTSSITASMLYTYLDDSNGSNYAGIKMENIPFAKYKVYVYFNRDSGDGQVNAFPTYSFNGTKYAGNGSETVAVVANQVWGTALKSEIADGVNALVVGGLTNSTLTIKGEGGGGRGCISGIQIMEFSEILDAEPEDMFWRGGNGNWSDANWSSIVANSARSFIENLPTAINAINSLTINVDTNVTPEALTLSAATGTTLTLSGTEVISPTSLAISGEGSVALSAAVGTVANGTNTYSNPLSIDAGSTLTMTAAAGTTRQLLGTFTNNGVLTLTGEGKWNVATLTGAVVADAGATIDFVNGAVIGSLTLRDDVTLGGAAVSIGTEDSSLTLADGATATWQMPYTLTGDFLVKLGSGATLNFVETSAVAEKSIVFATAAVGASASVNFLDTSSANCPMVVNSGVTFAVAQMATAQTLTLANGATLVGPGSVGTLTLNGAYLTTNTVTVTGRVTGTAQVLTAGLDPAQDYTVLTLATGVNATDLTLTTDSPTWRIVRENSTIKLRYRAARTAPFVTTLAGATDWSTATWTDATGLTVEAEDWATTVASVIVSNTTAGAALTIDRNVNVALLAVVAEAPMTISSDAGTLTASTIDTSLSTAAVTLSLATGSANITAGSETILAQKGTGRISIDVGKKVTLANCTWDPTKITNNGTVNILGGTPESPITMTSASDLGVYTIAANSVFKQIATGGNKVYKVTGAGANTSTFIMESDQGWGMDVGTQIRGVKAILSTSHGFWLERADAFDASVDLVTQIGRTVNVNDPGTSFTLGSLSGGGTLTGSGKTITLNMTRGATTFSGTCAASLVVNGSDPLTLSGANTGALTVNPNASVILSGSVGAVTNDGTFILTNDVDKTFASVISGTGSVVKRGIGLLTLSGANSYSGDTTIETGSVKVGHSSAFGSGAVTLNGGTIDVGTYRPTNTPLTAIGNTALSFVADAVAANSGVWIGDLTVTGGTCTVNVTLAPGATKLPKRCTLISGPITLQDAARIALGTVDVSNYTDVTATLTSNDSGVYLNLAGGIAEYFSPYKAATSTNADWTALNWSDANDILMDNTFDWSTAAAATLTATESTTATVTANTNIALSGALTINGAGDLTLTGDTLTAASYNLSEATGVVTLDFATDAANITAGANTILTQTGTGTLTIAAGKKATAPGWANAPSGAGTFVLKAEAAETAITPVPRAFTGTTKVVQGTLSYTAGGVYPLTSPIIVDGQNATLKFSNSNDISGYESPNANKRLTIRNGGTFYLAAKRDTFSTPLVLENGGKVQFEADSQDSNRSFDFFTGSSLTVNGTGNTIGGRVATQDASTGDPIVASGIVSLRANNFTVTVNQDATLDVYAQWGGANSTGNAWRKNGTGKMSLYRTSGQTGSVAVNAGTLALVNKGQVSSGTMTLADNTTLELNVATNTYTQTVANVISGAGRVVKLGPGTTTLTGANTYTGGTTISAGTLKATGTNAAFGTGTVTISSGTLDLTAFAGTLPSLATSDATARIKCVGGQIPTFTAVVAGTTIETTLTPEQVLARMPVQVATLPQGASVADVNVVVTSSVGERVNVTQSMDAAALFVTPTVRTLTYTPTGTPSTLAWNKTDSSFVDEATSASAIYADFDSVKFITASDKSANVTLDIGVKPENLDVGSGFAFTGTGSITTGVLTKKDNGDSAMDVKRVDAGALSVASGSLTIKDIYALTNTVASGASFAAETFGKEQVKYVRLSITKIAGSGQPAAVAEFRLFRGATRLEWPVGTTLRDSTGATATKGNVGYPGAIGSSNEQIGALIDGWYGSSGSQANGGAINRNKWIPGPSSDADGNCTNAVGSWQVTIEFPEPVVAFDGANFCTADGGDIASKRFPKDWTIETSLDGETWKTVSATTNATFSAFQWNGTGENDPYFKNVASVVPTLSVASNATLVASGAYTAAITLEPDSTLKLTESSPLVLAPGSTLSTTGPVTLDVSGITMPEAGAPAFTFLQVDTTVATAPEASCFVLPAGSGCAVVKRDTGYALVSSTLTQPFTATATGDATWTDLHWVDVNGLAVSRAFDWSTATLTNVTLRVTADATVSVAAQTPVNVGMLTINASAPLNLSGSVTATSFNDSASTAAVTLDCATGDAAVTAGVNTILKQTGSGALTIATGKKATINVPWTGIIAQTGTLVYAGTHTYDGAKKLSENATTEIAGDFTQTSSVADNGTNPRDSSFGINQNGTLNIKSGTITPARFLLNNMGTAGTITVNHTGGSVNMTAGTEPDNGSATTWPYTHSLGNPLFGHWVGSTTYNLSGGMFNAENRYVGLNFSPGSATFNQSGGTFKVKAIVANQDNKGKFNLTGGTLELEERIDLPGTNRINLGAGTIKATGAFTFVQQATLTDSATGTTIDVDTYNVAITNVLAGTGKLVVEDSSAGNGVLTLSGANTYSGGTTIHAGTLKLGASGTFGTGDLTLADGVTLDLSVATIAITNKVASVPLNARVTIEVGTRTFNEGDYLLRWTTIPEGVFVVKGTTDRRFVKDATGLKACATLTVADVTTTPEKEAVLDAFRVTVDTLPSPPAADKPVKIMAVQAKTQNEKVAKSGDDAAVVVNVLGIAPEFTDITPVEVQTNVQYKAEIVYEFGIVSATLDGDGKLTLQIQVTATKGTLGSAVNGQLAVYPPVVNGVTQATAIAGTTLTNPTYGTNGIITMPAFDPGTNTVFTVKAVQP